MRLSGAVRAFDLALYASAIFLGAFCEGSCQTGMTIQASTRAPVQEEVSTTLTTEVRRDPKLVIVELITAAECAGCQSAEALLTRLDREQPVQNTDIIVISEHVDHSTPPGYLSPTDPTRRQEDYQNLGLDSQPAPLFLVNGVVQDSHVGISEIEQSIAAAPASSVPLKLTSVRVRGSSLAFTLDSTPPTQGYVNVYAAIVNRAGVVENFGRVGSSFRTKALGERPFSFQDRFLENHGSLDGMRLVVFLQTKHKGPMLGATFCVVGLSQPAIDHPAPASFPAIPCPTSIDSLSNLGR